MDHLPLSSASKALAALGEACQRTLEPDQQLKATPRISSGSIQEIEALIQSRAGLPTMAHPFVPAMLPPAGGAARRKQAPGSTNGVGSAARRQAALELLASEAWLLETANLRRVVAQELEVIDANLQSMRRNGVWWFVLLITVIGIPVALVWWVVHVYWLKPARLRQRRLAGSAADCCTFVETSFKEFRDGKLSDKQLLAKVQRTVFNAAYIPASPGKPARSRGLSAELVRTLADLDMKACGLIEQMLARRNHLEIELGRTIVAKLQAERTELRSRTDAGIASVADALDEYIKCMAAVVALQGQLDSFCSERAAGVDAMRTQAFASARSMRADLREAVYRAHARRSADLHALSVELQAEFERRDAAHRANLGVVAARCDAAASSLSARGTAARSAALAACERTLSAMRQSIASICGVLERRVTQRADKARSKADACAETLVEAQHAAETACSADAEQSEARHRKRFAAVERSSAALRTLADGLCATAFALHAASALAARGAAAAEKVERLRSRIEWSTAQVCAERQAAMARTLMQLEEQVGSIAMRVQSALADRSLSLAVCTPDGSCLRHAKHAREHPHEFQEQRILRYAARDLLRLGSFPLPPGDAAPEMPANPPLFLSLGAPTGVAHQRCRFAPGTDERSVVVIGNDAPRAAAADQLVRQLALRSLGLRRPSMVQLSVIDPVRSGGSLREVGLLQGLAFEKPRLAVDSYQIENLLAEHRNELTRMILDELASGDGGIESLLATKRGESIPFRVLCVFGFPLGFDARSAQELLQLCTSGDAAGIHVFISFHGDAARRALERDPKMNVTFPEVAAHIRIDDAARGEATLFVPPSWPGQSTAPELQFRCDAPFGTAETELIVESLRHDATIRENRRRSPLAVAKALPEQLGGRMPKASREVLLPIGSVDGDEVVAIPFGRDTAHHAVMVGATGSGKTRLLQGMVAAGCHLYTPDELSFWLLDFKSGTGFLPFSVNQVPHCHAIGLSSDVTYGLDALEKLVAEMARRQVLFKRSGVENLQQYASAIGASGERLPRIVAIADEFQLLFGKDSASRALALVAQIVQKGRSAGIHLFLCTQALTGAAGDVDLVLSQIKVRVVLKSDSQTQRGVIDRDDLEQYMKLGKFEGLVSIDGVQRVFDALDMPDREGLPNANLRDALSSLPRMASSRVPLVYDGEALVPLPTEARMRDLVRAVRAARDYNGIPIVVGTACALTGLPANGMLRKGMSGNAVVSVRDEALAESLLASMILSVHASREQESLEVELIQSEWLGSTWRRLRRLLPDSVRITEHDSTVIEAVLSSIDTHAGAADPKRRRLVVFREFQLYKGFEDESILGSSELRRIMNEGPSRGVHALAISAAGAKLHYSVRDSFTLRIASYGSAELEGAGAVGMHAQSRLFIEDPERPSYFSECIPFTLFIDEQSHPERS